jgi:hypothetical protein
MSNTVEINGRTFKYKITRWFNGRPEGRTIFYEEETHHKFLWWKWTEPIELFYVSIDIESPNYSKKEVGMVVLIRFLEFEKHETRLKEIQSNQLI